MQVGLLRQNCLHFVGISQDKKFNISIKTLHLDTLLISIFPVECLVFWVINVCKKLLIEENKN